MASETIPILEGFSTQSFHQFKVPSGNTFDDPVTPEGRVWRGAVKSLSEVDGWLAAWWGRREECIEEVGLILGTPPTFSTSIINFQCLLAIGYFPTGLAQ